MGGFGVLRVVAGVSGAVLLLGACSADYAEADFVGTFADGEGGVITLEADGTGVLVGLEGEGSERVGTWRFVESEYSTDFIDFGYDEPDPEMGSAANQQIWVGSDDELYLLPEGPDGSERQEFERAGV
ncbi:hypothetical protein [Glycomyces paridis]|uniref:Uncharacterized protein n=1 Tax=Glycomyces paridis TaxID=2126555 RepID=A0A4S8PKL8_9ACTN|nr:hypothetical protein [Glycomyces paridis]THV29019.1 hypothetical protein E9998_09725 [Glycomyces paridis]